MSRKWSCVICLESVEPDPGGGGHEIDGSCSEAQFCASFKCIRLNTSVVSDAWQRLRRLCSDSNGAVRSIPSVYCRKCRERNEAAFEILKKLEDLKLKCRTLKKELVQDIGGPKGSEYPTLTNNLARLRMAVDAQRRSSAEVGEPSISEEEDDLKLFVEPVDEGGSPFLEDLPDSYLTKPDATLTNSAGDQDLLRQLGIKEARVVLHRLTKARIRQLQPEREETDVLLEVKSSDSTETVSESKDGIRTRSRKVYARRRSSLKPAKKRVKLESDYETEVDDSDEEVVPYCTLQYCNKKFASVPELKEHMHSDHGLIVSDDDVDETELNFDENGSAVNESSNGLTKEQTEPGSSKLDSIPRAATTKRLKCTHKNCPFQKTFSTRHKRERHLKKYHKRAMADRCPIPGCPSLYRLYSEEEKQQHQTWVHGDDLHPWRCKVCKKHFKTRAEKINHEQVEHSDMLSHVCHICGMGFERQYDLQVHIDNHMGELKYSCSECKRELKTRAGLAYHRATHHRNASFQCEECGRSFFVHSELRRHLRIHLAPEKWMHKCEKCGEKFPSYKPLYDHKYSKCFRGPKMPPQRQRKKAAHETRKSRCQSVRVRTCKWCSQTFGDQQLLLQHIEEVHNIDKTYKMKCYYIGCTSTETFANRFERDAHIQKYHSDKILKLYNCSVCSEGFGKKTELNSHMLKHSGKPIFQCQECPKFFGSNSGLYLHVQTIHRGKRYPCEICGTSYGTNDHLKQHLIRSHGNRTEERSYTCDQCDQTFETRNQFRGHKYFKHGGEHACHLCKKTFRNRGYLGHHIRQAHAGKNLRYECKICGEKFKTERCIRFHFSIHRKGNGLTRSPSEATA